ncbi:hypothetical protein niasHS_000532 [Heterodera schachtii]|uniref:BED-type domain-containing protein n=1 Tax=Heterodera schachtii TaxID=97005 RepID=A0ABD2K4K0_HETSC
MNAPIFASHSFDPRNFLTILNSNFAVDDKQMEVKDPEEGRSSEEKQKRHGQGDGGETDDGTNGRARHEGDSDASAASVISFATPTEAANAVCASSSSSASSSLSSSTSSSIFSSFPLPSATPFDASGGAFPSDPTLPQGVWCRNAGRKKSHPVWTFFQDLRDSNGIGGVACLHCDWTGDDRSPNNLKTHLKRCHDNDGVFKQFTLNMALTPTQPYVKRKRHKERQPSEFAAEESPLYVPLVAAVSQQSAEVEQLQQQLHSRAALSSSPAVPSFGCAVPSSANAIPCSALASSAFSKYSTAALLMENGSAGGGCSVGTASPSHAAEAPKQCFRSAEGQHSQQQQSHPLPAPRPKYGMEALSGMDNSPLTMTAGVADSAMFANLDAAVAMNHLLTEYQHQQQKNSSNSVQSMHQNVQQKLASNRNCHAQQQMNGQQLNELLAIYAASALQQQQQKSADPQQQQLAAQQAAAAVSWLYNWEWMTAAAAATSKPTQQQKPVNSLNLTPVGTTPTKVTKGTPNERRTAAGGSSNSNNGNALNMLMSAGIPLLSALSLGGIGTGNNGTAEVAQRNCEEMKPQQQQTNPNKQQTKRKSPAEERDCAASLLALADRAATDPSQRGGPSPPKNRKLGEHCEKQPQDNQNGEGNAANGLADGASEALAESLVLYGMHRIAMELQLSYYVHGNKAGRAEYAFYCSNTDGNANANVQRMVTLTESADQLLHIREHANGTVVAEECWPKNAEPGTLLLSLRDKCQRRLCA